MKNKRSNNANPFFSSVFIDCWAGMDDQFGAFCKVLRERHNTVFTFLVSSPKRKAVIEKWCEPDDVIVVESEDVLISTPDSSGIDESLAKAATFETLYNVSYMKDIIFPDRSLSCGFKLYADTSVFNYTAMADFSSVISQINRSFEFYSQLFEERKISFLLAQPSGHLFTPMIYVAKKNNTKITFPMSSRIERLYSFGSDEMMGNELIKSEFMKLGDEIVNRSSFEPRPLMEEHLKQAIETTSVQHLIKQCMRATFNRAIFLAIDLKNRRISKRASYLSVTLNLFAKWQVAKWLVNNSTKKITKQKGQKIFTFFMQVEPEVTSNHYNKEFNNSLAFIQQLSASLPVHCKLYIKEHFSNIGNRSNEFYARIKALPNVDLLDFRLRGSDVLAETDVVVTGNGTVGVEASLLGLPVIVYSKHAQYNFLKNVQEVEDLFHIENCIKKVCEEISSQDREVWINDAFKYNRAVKNVSYNVPFPKEQGLTGEMPAEEVTKAIELLEKIATSRI